MKNKGFSLKALLLLVVLPLVLGVSVLISNRQVLHLPSFGFGNTFLVSKTNSSANWTELGSIDWSKVSPGDTIQIDGGTYNTALVVGSSGSQSSPITIKAKGPVLIFGGRSVNGVYAKLPECDQSSYVDGSSNARNFGINFNDKSYIVVDGMAWSGITIYGHNRDGVRMSGSHNTLRNVEMYDNGQVNHPGTGYRSDQPGVLISGTDDLFDRDLIHDNGQDAFQAGSPVGNITITNSWLYNSRPHSSNPSLAFNFCMHSDGFQIYTGGVQSGLTFSNTILGPGLMQGTILGQSSGSTAVATVNNVNMSDVLILDTTNANIMGYTNTPSQNWKLDRVTSFHTNYDPDGVSHLAMIFEGTFHTLSNSIFYGGSVYTKGGVSFSGNIQANLAGTAVGTNQDPQFASAPAYNSVPTLAILIAGDYTSPSGKGSRLTSVRQLLASGTAASSPLPTPIVSLLPQPSITPVPVVSASAIASATPVVSPSVKPSPTATPKPSPSPTPKPTSQPITLDAGSGNIVGPFTLSQGSISQTTETTNPENGGKASYIINIPSAGNYQVQMLVNAPNLASNSLFVNFDSEPSSPMMVWDIPTGSGFSWRTLSWRGNGTVDANQYNPKTFSLTAGNHTLIIRGREANTQINKISITAQGNVEGASTSNPSLLERLSAWVAGIFNHSN